MTQHNEAAERLAVALEGAEAEARDNYHLLTEALAAERRATVERIRERLGDAPSDNVVVQAIRAILDEELRTADDSAKAAASGEKP